MCDRVSIYERCIAVQLQRDTPPPKPPPPKPPQYPDSPQKLQQQSQPYPQRGARFLQFQYGSLHRKQGENSKQKEEGSPLKSQVKGEENTAADNGVCSTANGTVTSPKGVNSPLSSNSSGTPTPTNPTNGVSPFILQNFNPTANYNICDKSTFRTYQEGYQLYQCWVATNAECVWDEELVRAVNATHFVGFLVGGFILVGGPPRVMAAITHAHSRGLLNAPPGWIILVLGELRECEVAVVQRGQFTPLGDALCWAIHRLSKCGLVPDQKGIHNALLTHFPAIAPPEPALIHAALSDLIRQRKVFHSGKGYGIVQAHTYIPEPASPTANGNPNLPPRLLTTSEALTKAHGAAETEKMGDVCHAAVQTDLADLLAGVWPTSSILIPRPQTSPKMTLQRSGSFRGEAQNLSSLLGERDRGPWQAKYQVYEAYQSSDIAIKGGEKGSVICKLLRVSQPRRRLASFSAQFPPPEWSYEKLPVKHLHSVATQTRSSRHPGGPETCWMPTTHWAPRSSTLPRKPSKMSSSPAPIDALYRPHSTSPSPIKLPYKKTYVNHHGHPQAGHVPPQHVSSSSVSPCITSAQSSRTTSPSLQSAASTQYRENRTLAHPSRSLSPYKGTSPKHKSMSPSNNHVRHHSSSSHPSQAHVAQSSLQRSPMRKPPMTSSPHHTSPKDQKRRALSLMPSEETLGTGASTMKRENVVEISNLKTGSSSIHPSNANSPIRSKVRVKTLQNAMSREGPGTNEEVKCTVSNKVGKPEEESNKRQVKIKKEDKDEEVSQLKQQTRSSLQLDLPSEVHMNNFRKVVASPQKPEGLKNNVFHENLSSIAKGSVSDLTSKNMGYRDINKCDKKLYADETQQTGTEKEDSEIPAKEETVEETRESDEKTTITVLDEKRRLKLSLPLTDASILSEGSLRKLEKKLHQKSLISLDNKNEICDKSKIVISPLEDNQSVKTYPSLSELNLTFSSLTAQKILQGVSVNSIDTLVEVNMLAEKRKTTGKEGVTNTDFGFV